MGRRDLDDSERVPISEATRTLLCDLAAGDVNRPLHCVAADWEEVLMAVQREALLGLTFHYLRQTAGADYPPSSFREQVQRIYRVQAIRMALVYRTVRRVLGALNDADLDYLVIKGPALAAAVYPVPALRSFVDLDIVVRERDWERAHRALVEMGFVSQEGLPQPPPKLIPEAVLYEQKYYHAEMGLMVEVHYDDLLNTGLASRDVEGFWRRSVWVEVEGIRAKTLSLEDTLIHLCAHVHYHGFTRLSWLADLAFIVRDHTDELHWPLVLEIARREEVQVPVYYTLRTLRELLSITVPADVLEAIKPDGLRRWMHERFLPERKVLSMQPMWRPDFSFYFQPLLKRLLPDLLVMGRRKEKLRCLWHLLAPPAAWLRTYYRIPQGSGLAVHYVLHPLKLLGHYLEEICAAPFKHTPRADARGGDVAAA